MNEPYTINDLLRVMARLRDPQSGCPWDLAQDFRSIVPSTLEECYELAQAIEDEDYPHVAEELGDVLFQVVFYAQLGAERELFAFESIVDTLVRKLVRRHPHVFDGGDIDGPGVSGRIPEAEVKRQWEAIKREERRERDHDGHLDDVPLALPALSRAQKLQKRAAGFGFDWPATDAVLAKVEEELAELRQAIAAGNEAETGEELGDLMFTCVNLARHLGWDSEAALRQASAKFEKRVRGMESLARQKDRSLDDMTETELDVLWRQVKGKT